MKINSDVLNKGFLYVKGLLQQHQGRTSMTSDQLAGKILYDLQEKFDDAPELELVSIVALAALLAEHQETVNYLKQEFLDMMEYYSESGIKVELELQHSEAGLFQLFAGGRSGDFFQERLAV